MEILVRRGLYPLLNEGQSWHRGLAQDDGIQILQPPTPRLPMSMVEVLANPNELAFLIAGALRPVRGTARADLLVATHDADGAAPAVQAVSVVNRNLRTDVPLLLPAPEIQAWLARKRAIEQAYERPYCSVPEPEEEALRRDAKAELQRLLGTFGGKLDARMQASLATWVSEEDLGRYAWTGWSEVPGLLKTAHEAESAHRTERALLSIHLPDLT